MNIIDGKKCSQDIREKLIEEIKLFPTKPKLVDIQIGDNSASDIYIKMKDKACNEVGITFECVRYSSETEEEIVIKKINELNNDKNINGILIQLPLPDKFNPKKLTNMINPSKDVDGLTEVNAGKLFVGNEALISCTPAGVMELLKYYNIPIMSKHVVIVGRSNLVGKPLINLFLNEEATVTVCHSKTIDLGSYTKQADILVVAVGKRNLITKDMVKEDAVVVDIGINRVDGKIYGDVDYENVKEKTSYITPVPGGVGPMTVTMLLYNVVKSYKKENSIN